MIFRPFHKPGLGHAACRPGPEETRETRVLDVRQPAEQHAGHVPQAHHICGSVLAAQLEGVPEDKKRTTVRTLVIRACVLLMLVVWSAAATAAAGDPEQLMRAATDTILARLRASPALRNDHDKLVSLIEKEVFPLVDFKLASRLTLAEHWRDASASQQQRFVQQMRKLLACTYSAAFANYAGQSVEYLQPRWSQQRDRVEVRVRITQEGRQPVPLSYRMQKTDGQWKIYDMVVEGISLVANYRSTFRDKLHNEDLDALIADLASRGGKACNAKNASNRDAGGGRSYSASTRAAPAAAVLPMSGARQARLCVAA